MLDSIGQQLEPSGLDVQVNLAGILEQASLLTGFPCHFILDTAHRPFRGGENLVFAVEDSRRTRVGIRVPRYRTPFTAQLVETEVQHRQTIEREKIGRFQQLIGYSSSCDNPVQASFIALKWADGSPLQWTDSSPADENDRDKVIRAIAQTNMDLLMVRKKACTAKEYITTKIDRKIARAERGDLHGRTVAECLQQKRLILDYWLPELDDCYHVLVHGDRSANNIIVDEHFDVKGIIDLGWANFVPLQFAASYPRFLTHEPLWNGSSVEWSNKNTAMMRRDRKFYLQCIHERAVMEGGMLEDYYRVISREDEIKRYWWIAAASQIDVHIAMVFCDWAPPILAKDS